jgi:chromosome segregation ATPase
MTKHRTQYTATLKNAEQRADDHADTLYTEKTAELEKLHRELAQLREQTQETAFTQTQTRTRAQQQSKAVSLENHKRIQQLEDQLLELGASRREELREVRAKVEECLSAVDVRERDHRIEIERYQRELAEREQQYTAHWDILREQFESEKARLEQQLEVATTKDRNLRKILAQLQKHHEMQMETTRRDNERMKAAIYQAKSRDDDNVADTKSYVAQLQAKQQQCRQIKKEIAMVNSEIAELAQENKELQAELYRLDPSAAKPAAPKRQKWF